MIKSIFFFLIIYLGPRKSILAPGIANYIKRFNQISFWTMNEILLASNKYFLFLNLLL